jgi:hypothetical protein
MAKNGPIKNTKGGNLGFEAEFFKAAGRHRGLPLLAIIGGGTPKTSIKAGRGGPPWPPR